MGKLIFLFFLSINLCAGFFYDEEIKDYIKKYSFYPFDVDEKYVDLLHDNMDTNFIKNLEKLALKVFDIELNDINEFDNVLNAITKTIKERILNPKLVNKNSFSKFLYYSDNKLKQKIAEAVIKYYKAKNIYNRIAKAQKPFNGYYEPLKLSIFIKENSKIKTVHNLALDKNNKLQEKYFPKKVNKNMSNKKHIIKNTILYLLSYNLLNSLYGNIIFAHSVAAFLPKLCSDIKECNSQYYNIQYINRGGSHYVFKANLQEKEEEIAVRISVSSVKCDMYNNKIVEYANNGYKEIASFRNNTPYFCGHHGAYVAQDLPHNISKHIPKSPYKEGSYACRMVEFGEYISKAYDYKSFFDKGNKITDRIIFEHMLGEYLARDWYTDDAYGDLDAHRLLKLEGPVAYNFIEFEDNTKIFLFEPGYSPRKIDYVDAFGPRSKGYFEGKIFLDNIYSDHLENEKNLENFLINLNEENFFEKLNFHFKDHIIDNKNLIPENAKIYYIKKLFIDNLHQTYN